MSISVIAAKFIYLLKITSDKNHTKYICKILNTYYKKAIAIIDINQINKQRQRIV